MKEEPPGRSTLSHASAEAAPGEANLPAVTSDEPGQRQSTGALAPEAALGELPAGLRRDIRTVGWLRSGLSYLAIAGLAVLAAACFTYLLPGRGSEATQLTAGLLVSAATIAAVFLGPWRRQLGASRRLARAGDVRCVGPLLESLVLLGHLGTGPVRGALLPLLERMQTGDYALLTASQRLAIRRILTQDDVRLVGWFSRARRFAPVRLALLRMLQRCGGRDCVSAVAYLARRTRDPGVREVAQECLEALKARLAEEQPAAELLRPAEAPEAAALLRPAGEAPQAPAEQLLRPVEGARPDEGR